MAQHGHAQTSIRSSGDLLADRRYGWAEGALADGDVVGAADLAEQVIEIAPGYAPAWFLLGDACADARSLGADSRSRARTAFARVLQIDPADSLGARMRLSQLGDGDDATALTPAYVRALFDGYAQTFDRHLVDGLGYHAPALLRDAILFAALAHGAEIPFRHVLDLGCGTGLMGLALADVALAIAGVDLSPGMLEKARRLGRYQSLAEGDLVDFLDERPDVADLVVAADVLVYVRDPLPALAAAFAALRSGGLMAFTMQSWDGDGARLGADGRYAHGRDVIRAVTALNGFEARTLDAVSVRRQAGVDVPGWLVILRKP